jgi:hypothetical protein
MIAFSSLHFSWLRSKTIDTTAKSKDRGGMAKPHKVYHASLCIDLPYVSPRLKRWSDNVLCFLVNFVQTVIIADSNSIGSNLPLALNRVFARAHWLWPFLFKMKPSRLEMDAKWNTSYTFVNYIFSVGCFICISLAKKFLLKSCRPKPFAHSQKLYFSIAFLKLFCMNFFYPFSTKSKMSIKFCAFLSILNFAKTILNHTSTFY